MLNTVNAEYSKSNSDTFNKIIVLISVNKKSADKDYLLRPKLFKVFAAIRRNLCVLVFRLIIGLFSFFVGLGLRGQLEFAVVM